MQNLKSALFVLASVAISLPGAFGQSVISAKSGVIHLAQGDVYVGDQKIDQKFGTFPDIKENAKLRTEEGRAEVLLTPGIILRVGEASAIRMVTNRLIDTRVEFLSGEAMIESSVNYKENKDTHVTVVYGDYTITIARHGLFGLQSNPAQLKVFSGEVEVAHKGEVTTVKEGRLLPFTGPMIAEKFDAKDGDALYRWSEVRSQSLSVANLSAAKSAIDGGYYAPASGAWFYNSFYGMYTYLPGGNSLIYSPFGNIFYSPRNVYANFYQPVRQYYTLRDNSSLFNNGRVGVVQQRSNTLALSNTAPAAPAKAAAPAPTTGAGGGISLGGGRAGGHGR